MIADDWTKHFGRFPESNPEKDQKSVWSGYITKLKERYESEMERDNGATNIPNLQKSLTGKWKLTSLINASEYLKLRGASEPHNVFFKSADVDIHFDDASETVKLHEQSGEHSFYEKVFKLNKAQCFGDVGSITYYSKNSLSTMYIADGIEEQEDRFVRDGKLHVLVRRSGVECTRIYSKPEPPITKQFIGNSKMYEQIAKDLLQQEISPLQAKLISLGVKPPNEQLQSTKIHKIAPPITKQFIGNWQDVKNPAGTTSLNISNNQFIRKWNGSTFIDELGVKRAGGRYTYVDGEKIVHKALGEHEEVLYVSEYSMENGLMVYTGYPPNGRKNAVRYVHRRIGEPI